MLCPLHLIKVEKNNREGDMESNESNFALSKWQMQKSILREKFKRLTEQDLDFDQSRRNEMIGRLARKLGMTSREIQRIIDQIF
jgi:hypothetical protein